MQTITVYGNPNSMRIQKIPRSTTSSPRLPRTAYGLPHTAYLVSILSILNHIGGLLLFVHAFFDDDSLVDRFAGLDGGDGIEKLLA